MPTPQKGMMLYRVSMIVFVVKNRGRSKSSPAKGPKVPMTVMWVVIWLPRGTATPDSSYLIFLCLILKPNILVMWARKLREPQYYVTQFILMIFKCIVIAYHYMLKKQNINTIACIIKNNKAQKKNIQRPTVFVQLMFKKTIIYISKFSSVNTQPSSCASSKSFSAKAQDGPVPSRAPSAQAAMVAPSGVVGHKNTTVAKDRKKHHG